MHASIPPPLVEPVPPFTVMIVDDDPVDAAQIARLLNRCEPPPSTLIEHHDPQHALKRLVPEAPDVVFVDQMLGGERGLDVIQAMRTTWPRAEYVLLTGMGDEAIAAASLRMGVSDYLSKNGLTTHILERSLRYLRTRRIVRLAKEASAQQLHTIFNASADLLAVLDPLTGTVIEVNEAGRRLLGHAIEDLKGKPLAPLLPEAHWRRLSAQVTSAQREPSPILRVQIRRADNTLCPMDASVTQIPWQPPHGTASLLTLRDASPHLEVATVSGQLGALVEHAPMAVISSTPDGQITAWNSAAKALYGHSAEQILGSSILSLGTPDHLETLRALYDRAAAGAVISKTLSVHRHSTGDPIPVQLTITAVREGRTVHGLSTVVEDLRPLRTAEARIEALTADLDRLNTAMKAMQGPAQQVIDTFSDSLETELVSKRVLEHQLKTARGEAEASRETLSAVTIELEQARRRNAELVRRLERLIDDQGQPQAVSAVLPHAAILIEPPGNPRVQRTLALTRLGVQTSAVNTPKQALSHTQHEEPGVILVVANGVPDHGVVSWVGRLKRDMRTAEIPMVVLLDGENETLREQVLEAGTEATLALDAPIESLASLLGTLVT
ncbi:MAG: PAS domain S-box protein [Bradymonadia bacterium]